MQRRILPTLQRGLKRPNPTIRLGHPRHLTSAADIQFGQPLHETHPHLIKHGELTPGITALEYHHRRAALAQKLPPNSAVVLAAADLKYRSGAVFYEYHQDPNFFYLTGFTEPDALAVIQKGQTDAEYTFHLFVRPKDAHAELWDGARSGVQAALDVFNADEAHDIHALPTHLPHLLHGIPRVYTDLVPRPTPKTPLARFLHPSPPSSDPDPLTRLLRHASVRPLRPLLNELRLTKSPAELALMRRAGSHSGLVLTDAMRRPHATERHLGHFLAAGFRAQGLDREAYVPVVGGGPNALSIHYVRNDAELRAGELVLVDAGGEVGGYITDITRTWPVGGRWSDAQRDLYAMVLGVQERGVAMCTERAEVSLDVLHRVTEDGLREGLRALGFEMGRKGALEVLFPPHVSDFIGLDVHDAPGWTRSGRLRQDQCITIEPGVYVPVDDERWPVHFRGLGVRIEDSVRVGLDEVEVLTSSAVKGVKEIEALREV